MTARAALRTAAVAATAFNGLTATGGGLAILAGLEDFPPEWLHGTPFESYTVPALLLTGVGVSGLAAFGSLLGRRRRAGAVTLASGLLLAGFVAGEIALLDQTPPVPTPTEWVYLASGLLTAGLGVGFSTTRDER